MLAYNGELMLDANYIPTIITEHYFFMVNQLNSSLSRTHHTFWVLGTMM
jgi:hypothetical protein